MYLLSIFNLGFRGASVFELDAQGDTCGDEERAIHVLHEEVDVEDHAQGDQ